MSFAYYLSKEEFKFILDAIEFIAEYGHRFLPLYKFNWITGDWTFRKLDIKYRTMKQQMAVAANVFHLDEMSLSKVVAVKPKWNLENHHTRFERYLESAKIVALSLPSISQQVVCLPKGIDTDMILFHV